MKKAMVILLQNIYFYMYTKSIIFLFSILSTLHFSKQGKNKRNNSAENKTSPERKKILLTGASPLEMFQTKMAINTSSSSQFLVNFLQNDVNNHQENKTKPKNNRSLSDSSGYSKSQLDLAAEEILASTSLINNVNQGKVLPRAKKRTASLDTNLINANNGAIIKQQNLITTTHPLYGQLQEILTTNKSKTDFAEINKALSALQNLQAATTTASSNQQQQKQMHVSPLMQTTSSTVTIPHLPSQMSSKVSQKIHLVSKNQPTATTDIISLTAPQQQMLLLQLVNQNKTLLSNSSLLSAIPAQSYATTTGGKIIISPTPSPLQTIALQKSQQIVQQQQTTNTAVSGTGRPVHIAPSVKTNTVPVQYVVSPTGTLTFQHQPPIVRLMSQTTASTPFPAPLLPLKTATTNNTTNSINKNIQSVTGIATCNYVRIAPAALKPLITTAEENNSKNITTTSSPTIISNLPSPLELENEKQRRNVYASMQQHITEKNLDSQTVYENIPAARQFLTNMVNEENAKKLISSDNVNNELLPSPTSSPLSDGGVSVRKGNFNVCKFI